MEPFNQLVFVLQDGAATTISLATFSEFQKPPLLETIIP